MKFVFKRILTLVLVVTMLVTAAPVNLLAQRNYENLLNDEEKIVNNELAVKPAKPADDETAEDLIKNPAQPAIYTLRTDYLVNRASGEEKISQPYVARVGEAISDEDKAKINKTIDLPNIPGYTKPAGNNSFDITYQKIIDKAKPGNADVDKLGNEVTGYDYVYKDKRTYTAETRKIKVKHVFQDFNDFNKYGKKLNTNGQYENDDIFTTVSGEVGEKIIIKPLDKADITGYTPEASEKIVTVPEDTSNYEIEYRYKRAMYTLKFDVNDGTEIPERKLYYGQVIPKLNILPKKISKSTGKESEFLGWKPNVKLYDKNKKPYNVGDLIKNSQGLAYADLRETVLERNNTSGRYDLKKADETLELLMPDSDFTMEAAWKDKEKSDYKVQFWAEKAEHADNAKLEDKYEYIGSLIYKEEQTGTRPDLGVALNIGVKSNLIDIKNFRFPDLDDTRLNTIWKDLKKGTTQYLEKFYTYNDVLTEKENHNPKDTFLIVKAINAIDDNVYNVYYDRAVYNLYFSRASGESNSFFPIIKRNGVQISDYDKPYNFKARFNQSLAELWPSDASEVSGFMGNDSFKGWRPVLFRFPQVSMRDMPPYRLTADTFLDARDLSSTSNDEYLIFTNDSNTNFGGKNDLAFGIEKGPDYIPLHMDFVLDGFNGVADAKYDYSLYTIKSVKAKEKHKAPDIQGFTAKYKDPKTAEAKTKVELIELNKERNAKTAFTKKRDELKFLRSYLNSGNKYFTTNDYIKFEYTRNKYNIYLNKDPKDINKDPASYTPDQIVKVPYDYPLKDLDLDEKYTPTRPSGYESYAFNGWAFDPEGTKLVWDNNDTMPARNIVLYAIWGATNNKYKVSFDPNGGTLEEIKPESLVPTLKNIKEKNGALIEKKTFPEKTSPATADLSKVQEFTFIDHQRFIEPVKPKRKGYDFVGWEVIRYEKDSNGKIKNTLDTAASQKFREAYKAPELYGFGYEIIEPVYLKAVWTANSDADVKIERYFLDSDNNLDSHIKENPKTEILEDQRGNYQIAESAGNPDEKWVLASKVDLNSSSDTRVKKAYEDYKNIGRDNDYFQTLLVQPAYNLDKDYNPVENPNAKKNIFRFFYKRTREYKINYLDERAKDELDAATSDDAKKKITEKYRLAPQEIGESKCNDFDAINYKPIKGWVLAKGEKPQKQLRFTKNGLNDTDSDEITFYYKDVRAIEVKDKNSAVPKGYQRLTFKALDGGNFTDIDGNSYKEIYYDVIKGLSFEKVPVPKVLGANETKVNYKYYITADSGKKFIRWDKNPWLDESSYVNVSREFNAKFDWDDVRVDTLVVNESFKDPNNEWTNNFIPSIDKLKEQIKWLNKGNISGTSNIEISLLNDKGNILSEDNIYEKLKEKNKDDKDETTRIEKFKAKISITGKTDEIQTEVPVKVYKNRYEALTSGEKPQFLREAENGELKNISGDYKKVTVKAADKSNIYYVNPKAWVKIAELVLTDDEKLALGFEKWSANIKQVNENQEANGEFKFDKRHKFTEDTIIEAKTNDTLIYENEKSGYIKVTFDQGKHGKFNVTDPAQKTNYWVKPGTLVDLRGKAPMVSANAGYIHTGWSQDLVVNFKANAGDQTITAQYGLDSDYSYVEKTGYTKITFEKGTNGEFVKDAKTELWVNPAKELTVPAPGIIPNLSYSHIGWTKNGTAINLNEKAKYTEATTITAAYESDILNEEKAGFVKITFDAGTNGTIDAEAKKDFWVNPNKEVNLLDKAPTVTAKPGNIFIKWDHKLFDKFTESKTIKATYALAGDIKTEETTGFAHVKFVAGANGTFPSGTQVDYWVNPEKAVVLPEPRLIANKGYEHIGWDLALTPAKKYNASIITTITATYKKLVSTEEIDGHQEIKFLAGDDGTFDDGKKEISIWVKPDTLLDLRKSAPDVTVTTQGKTFTGWNRDLVDTFTKSNDAIVFTAQYSGSTSETPVPGWTEITFNAGNHGKFGTINNAVISEKKLWLDPKADVKLSDKAPKTIDDKNWSFDNWLEGQNAATGLDVANKYTEAKTYTAFYESDLSDQPKDGFVKITFAPGPEGTFDQDAVTETYVRKDKEVDLTEKAPKAKPNAGLSFKGWAIGSDAVNLTKIKVKSDTSITAQYTKAISDKPVDDWTRLQFNSGENGRFVKDAVTVKWVDPKVKLTLKAIAPGILPDKNYRLSAWNDGSANVDLDTEKLFKAPATFTAKYEKITSDTQEDSFIKITFNSGEHGNFGTKENNPVKEKDIWVNPKSEVKLSEIAPELVIDTNWSFDKWMDGQTAADMDKAQKFTAEKSLTATYESDFSDEAKDGFAKVEFKPGDHGKFEKINNVDQKTIVYVRKDKEVDIKEKEPKVTPDNGYYFTGWDKPLQKIYTQETIHTGKNSNAIASEAVDGWTQITFNAGDKGLFKADAKTVLWVKPNTKLALDKQVPGLEIEKGYSCIGWKKDKEASVTDLSVAVTYDKSTTFTAVYESDFSEGEKEGFIEVKFKAGDNGNFGKTTGASSTEVKEYSVWVRPDKEVDLTDQAPEVTPHVGWKANGWDKAITKVTVKADTAEADRTFTAQYVKDSDTSKTEKPGYKKITFNAGDHGSFPNNAETVVYVNPDSEIVLSTIAPKVNPAINYSFKAWNNGSEDVALDAKIKHAKETIYTAQYESDISDTAKNGFVEVKFDAGTDGEFKQVDGADQKTTFYVKKDKLVDLADVAPTATGKDKKTFTGWDSDLKKIFTDATIIKAKYTESICDKPVVGWIQLDFDQGDHGRFVKGQKNVKWVDPAVDLKLNDIAPKINPDPNWSLKAWNDGTADIDSKLAQKFTKATTFTATYENAFSPGEKEGFVKITFDQGEHGKFVKEAVKEIYVKKDVELDLREKAPTVIPNQAWGHKGWTINNKANDLTKVKVSGETTIKAAYAQGTFDAENIKTIIVLGPSQMGYGVGEKLKLDGLKVIAIDDAGLQETYDGVTNITAKGFTIAPANGTDLTMNDNDKHIVVTKGAGANKLSGKTITALKIHPNKSAKAENVEALNQNKVVDGKVTNQEKDTTTVTGKVKPGATVKITSADGQTDLTPQGGITVDPQTGNFTAEITKQKVGDKIQVIATEKGKQPSEPVDATVARDADNNDVADNKEKFDITKATGVKILQNPSKMKYSVTTIDGKTNFDANGLLIEVSDGSGKTKTYTYKDITEGADKDKFTLSPADKDEIGLKADGSVNELPFTVTVTGADTKPTVEASEKVKVILDADGNGKHDKEETTTITSVIARNIGTGTTSPKTKATFTTIEGVAEKGSTVTIKFTPKAEEGQTATEVTKTVKADANTGEYKLELKAGTEGITTDILLPADTAISARAKCGNKQDSIEITTKVFNDLDDDSKDDRNNMQKTAIYTASAINESSVNSYTTITGKAEANADIMAKYKGKTIATTKANASGDFNIEARENNAAIRAGEYISLTAQVSGKAISDAIIVEVKENKANKVKMTYIAFGQTSGLPPAEKEYEKGTSFILERGNGLRKGTSELKGWQIEGRVYKPGDSFTINRDTVAVAVWEDDNFYTVNFDTNGGSYMPPIKVKEGEKIGNIGVPRKEGFRFVRWRLNGYEFNPFFYEIRKDILLVAEYEKDTQAPSLNDIIPFDPTNAPAKPDGYVTVSFDADLGLKLRNVNFYYVRRGARDNFGEELTLSILEAPYVTVANGYEFDRWDKDFKTTYIDRDLRVTAIAKQSSTSKTNQGDTYVNNNYYNNVLKALGKNELFLEASYITGYNGLFRPYDSISRAEAAQILANALKADGYIGNSRFEAYYTDVNNEWYKDAIRLVSEAGLFKGYGDGSFKPNGQITIAEWIATLRRFQDLGKINGNNMGLRYGHWAIEEVEAAYRAGWLNIYTKGGFSFDADRAITRQEVVAIANRAFNRTFDALYLARSKNTLIRFADISEDMPLYEEILCASNTFLTDGEHYRANSITLDNSTFNIYTDNFVIYPKKFQYNVIR